MKVVKGAKKVVRNCDLAPGTVGSLCSAAKTVHYVRKKEWRKAAASGVGIAVGGGSGKVFKNLVGKKKPYKYTKEGTKYVHGQAAEKSVNGKKK